MIERYTLPRMGAIWSDRHRFDIWLKIELLACEAWAELGKIPPQELKEIRAKAGYDLGRIPEIEREVKHDVVAFLTAVAEKVGPAARYIHMGLTSSDVLDTALAVQLQEAAALLLEDLTALTDLLRSLALAHKETVMIGRTHGIHAEPITFGVKMALWYAEFTRAQERLARARDAVGTGKVSGAVGTYAHVPPAVEAHVCTALGLVPETVSSQIIPRDRHAEFVLALALAGASVEKCATEIRHLQRTEVLEVEEPFAEGQKGSSAMPHKRNPVSCEQVCGLARLLKGYAVAALEDVPLWHERDISHSSVERVVLPDSTILLDYMLVRFREILEGLRIYPERMRKNLQATRGLIFSQQVLLALIQQGVSREEAYRLVQRNAMASWEKEEEFQALLLQDPEVKRHLSSEQIAACFDLRPHLAHLNAIYARAGLSERRQP